MGVWGVDVMLEQQDEGAVVTPLDGERRGRGLGRAP